MYSFFEVVEVMNVLNIIFASFAEDIRIIKHITHEGFNTSSKAHSIERSPFRNKISLFFFNFGLQNILCRLCKIATAKIPNTMTW